MPNIVKTALYYSFNKTARLLAGTGMSRLPGVRATYDYLFRTLWPDRNIIEVEGSRMYVNLKDEILLRKTFEAYITTRHWDELTTAAFKSSVKEGDVVLDLGANLGYYSLLAARLVGGKGRVYSFEPEPRNFRLLLKNIELNGYDNITPLQKAVSDKTEMLKLFISSEDSGAHTIRESVDSRDYKESIDMEVVKLDEFFAGNTKPINVIKMDVEGSEPKAFQGMEKIIEENSDLKIFVEFYPDLIEQGGCPPEEFTRRIIEDYGFKITIIDDDWKNRAQLEVGSVAELMDFVKDRTIVNLFLQK
ncbi:FkbM family methyltransferase [Chloroflexota bacterium]